MEQLERAVIMGFARAGELLKLRELGGACRRDSLGRTTATTRDRGTRVTALLGGPSGCGRMPIEMANRVKDSIGGVGEFIRSQRALARMSLRQLADKAKVSNPYLSQIERGLYRPSAEVLKAIAEALNISAETLYARIGLVDPDREERRPSVEEAIRLDSKLTTDQKETLLSVYRNFAGSS